MLLATPPGGSWLGRVMSSNGRLKGAAAALAVCLAFAAAAGPPHGTTGAHRGSDDSARSSDLTVPHAPHRAFIMGIARDALPPSATVSSSAVYQGGALLFRVTEVQSATVTFLGRSSALPIIGNEGATYLAVPTEAALGPARLSVEVIDRAGDSVVLSLEVTVLKTYWTVDYITLPPGVGSGLTPEIIQAEADRLAAIYSGITPPLSVLPWLSPVDPATAISGYFGEQRSFDGGPPTGHHGGTDFASVAGDPVRATNKGKVVLAEELAVRGNTVIIDHGGGVFSGYSHLSEISVAAGQSVTAGELLGRVGTTGLSTGPHLHWELAVHGILVDGLRWLDGTQGF